MHIDIKPLEKSRVQLIIEIPSETVGQWRIKAVKKISQEATVPGFRKGHIPEQILINHYGEKIILDETIDLVIQNTYAKAVQEKEVKVVAKPEKVELTSYDPFKYEVVVAVMPEVKLKDYKKIKVKSEKVEVKDDEIDTVIKDVQKRFATYSEVEREIQKGDKVYVDFEGKDDQGVVLDGTTSKDHPLIVGENYFVDGFEDHLIGMKKDGEKTFTVTFPETYHAAHLKNKPVMFNVRIKKVEETKFPEVDEAFIEKLRGTAMSPADFRESIRKDMMEAKKTDARGKAEEHLFEKLLEVAEIELPEAMVEEEVASMIDDYANRLGQQGLSLEHVLTYQKKHLDDLKNEWKKNAHDRVAVRLIMQEIIKAEKPEVTEDEIQNEIDKVVTRYPEETREKARDMYRKGGVLWQNLEDGVRAKKVVDRFIEEPGS